MSSIFYKILLLTLLSLLSIVRNDMMLILVLMFICLISIIDNVKLNIKLLEVIFLLIFIFCISLISSIIVIPEFYDAIRDAWYLIKPILIIYSAYFLISKIDDKQYLFRSVIYIGVIASIIHLLKVVPDLFGETRRISEIRQDSGKGNIVEVFSFVFLYLNKDFIFFKNKKIKYILYTLLLISIAFYFSRTMFLLLFIVMFSMKGYLRLTQKSVKYLGTLFLGIILLFVVLNNMNLKANDIGVKGFLYKIKIAPSEIVNTEIDVNNKRELWDRFRAYEAIRAIETTKANGLQTYLIGSGLGSLVDLNFKVELSGENIQYIPIIHNGYIFVFFKAGILGLLAYLLLLFNLYLRTYNITRSGNYLITKRLLSTIGVYYAFTSLVITGIYNPSETILVFLGGALFLEIYFKNNNVVKHKLVSTR